MTPERLEEIKRRHTLMRGLGQEEALEVILALETAATDLASMKRYYRKPTHGPCCTCQACGQHYDDCRCHLDDVADQLETEHKAHAECSKMLAARIAECRELIERLECESEALETERARLDWLIDLLTAPKNEFPETWLRITPPSIPFTREKRIAAWRAAIDSAREREKGAGG